MSPADALGRRSEGTIAPVVSARVVPVALHHESRGPGDAPPLLLLHGLGCSSHDWGAQLAAFSPRYRVIAPDLRDHGRSPRGRGRPTIGAMAGDVAALLAGLDVPPAHVMGLSSGGCVALALAVDHPSRVRSLTLVNAFAARPPAGMRELAQLVASLALLAFAPRRVFAAHVARGLFPRPDQRGLYHTAVERFAANSRRTYLESLAALGSFDVRHRLAEVRCPTLVVAGADDTTVPLVAKTLLHRTMPRADLIIIPDSGHATPYDQPWRFHKVLRAFLDAH